jgi:hypothetical protein
MELMPLIKKYDINLLLTFGSYQTERFTKGAILIWPISGKSPKSLGKSSRPSGKSPKSFGKSSLSSGC